jgi:predicted permease
VNLELQDVLYEPDHLGAFVLVTLIIGGGAAWLTGRAIALTWRPWWQVVVYALVLAAAERFLHFALFEGTFLSAYYYAVDAAITLVFACLGLRITRSRQMTRQYGVVLRHG